MHVDGAGVEIRLSHGRFSGRCNRQAFVQPLRQVSRRACIRLAIAAFTWPTRPPAWCGRTRRRRWCRYEEASLDQDIAACARADDVAASLLIAGRLEVVTAMPMAAADPR